MIWVTWRQNRIEGFVVLGILVLSSILLLITGLNMAHDFQQSGLGDCLVHHKQTAVCGTLAKAFMNQYSPFLPFASALVLLPILLGVIVGAPLVAREFEQRTHQLA